MTKDSQPDNKKVRKEKANGQISPYSRSTKS